MPALAASIALKAQTPARLARAIEETLARVRQPAAGLVFVSGSSSAELEELVLAVSGVASGVPLLVVCGAGVLTERGELEDQPGVAAIVWAGGRAEALAIEASGADEVGEALARTIADRAGRTAPTVITFVRPEGFGPHVLEPLGQVRGAHNVFGGGSAPGLPLYAIGPDGRLAKGAAVALIVRDAPPPAIASSPACKLLMPLRRISECRGSMITQIEDEPALDVLSAVGQELSDQPLILAVLADEETPLQTGRPELLLRAVQGVDPVRRGLIVSDEVKNGMRLAFAIRDGGSARIDLEAATRDLAREIAGALPRFGLYVNCAGRGFSLHGAHDVDTRILRARFGDIPLAGLQSSFEIAPHAGRPALKLYTGVVALFTAPS